MTERDLKLKIRNLEQEVADLKVVIDTCQTALKSTDAVLKNDKQKHDEIFTTSAKWAMNYKI